MSDISTVISILVAILVFGLLIFVHELGHFLTAKACGIKVNEFALGMGPVILKHQKGETQYALRLFPIGGFVSMEGEDEESSDDRAFNRKPVWKRILVVVAGAFMNLLCGFLIVIVMVSTWQNMASTTVAKFQDNSMSHKTGLNVGDKILSINGATIHIDTDVILSLIEDSDGKVEMVVERNGKPVELHNVQFPLVSDGNNGKVMQQDFWVYPQQKTPLSVIRYSFYWTIAMIKFVWVTFISLFTGRFGLKDLAGPVGTTAAIGQAVSQGIGSLLYFVALIAVNLGVVNLFPLPALDGGRLFFLLIELIRRKPIKPKYEGYIHFVGFALLMLLMVVVTYNDILRLVKG